MEKNRFCGLSLRSYWASIISEEMPRKKKKSFKENMRMGMNLTRRTKCGKNFA